MRLRSAVSAALAPHHTQDAHAVMRNAYLSCITLEAALLARILHYAVNCRYVRSSSIHKTIICTFLSDLARYPLTDYAQHRPRPQLCSDRPFPAVSGLCSHWKSGPSLNLSGFNWSCHPTTSSEISEIFDQKTRFVISLAVDFLLLSAQPCPLDRVWMEIILTLCTVPSETAHYATRSKSTGVCSESRSNARRSVIIVFWRCHRYYRRCESLCVT